MNPTGARNAIFGPLVHNLHNYYMCYLNKPLKLASQPRIIFFSYCKASQIPHNKSHGLSIPHIFFFFFFRFKVVEKNYVNCLYFMLTLIFFLIFQKQSVFLSWGNHSDCSPQSFKPLFMPCCPSLHHCFPPSLCHFAEIPCSIPWQQNDSHLTGLSGRELPHHHVHLLFSLQLQWCGDQINLNVWPTASRTYAKYHWLLHDKWTDRQTDRDTLGPEAVLGLFYCSGALHKWCWCGDGTLDITVCVANVRE